MARKASPIGPHIHNLIEDARVGFAPAATAVWDGDDASFSRQTRNRSVKL